MTHLDAESHPDLLVPLGYAEHIAQKMKDHDPERGKAFVSGAATASRDHENTTSKVKVLVTHHLRHVNEHTGRLTGEMTDLQAQRVQERVKQARQPVTDRSFPDTGHAMHRLDPSRFTETVIEGAASIEAAGRR